MRQLHNIDIKDEANRYALEESVENYTEVRDSFIDGFNFCLEQLEKQYGKVEVSYFGAPVDVLMPKKKIL